LTNEPGTKKPGYGNRPWLIIVAFFWLWALVAVYLRYQLRRRRWAAIRVAGFDRLLAEWLPESPHALAREEDNPVRPTKPARPLLFLDLLWPLKDAVIAFDPEEHVYLDEIERAWILVAKSGTDALRHERIIHAAGWVGFGSVVMRTLLG
jgi:hypothetical protein